MTATRLLITVLLTLTVTYAVLMATYGQHLTGGTFGQRVRAIAARVFPVYAAAILVAYSTSSVVLVTLGDSMRDLPLFGSLALFFGVFVGLVLQGRTVDGRR